MTIAKFRDMISVACQAIGVDDSEVLVTSDGISIPSENIIITPDLSNGHRVWRVTTTFTIMSLNGASDREVTNIICEEPLPRIWVVARKVALTIAERHIDLSIDSHIA